MPLSSRWWRRQYNQEAKAWERRSNAPIVVAMRDELVSMLTGAVTEGGPWLDVGCGPGAHARQLSGYAVGTDQARGMLEVAAGHGGVALVQSNIERGLPFRDDAFAGALCLLVLHHVRDPGAAVSEIRRVLRPHGCALLTFAAKEFGPVRRQGLYWTLRAWGSRLPGIIRRFSAADVRALVDGLEIVDFRRVGGAHAVLVRDPEPL